MNAYQTIIFASKSQANSKDPGKLEHAAPAEGYPIHHLLGMQLLLNQKSTKEGQTDEAIEDKIVFYFTSTEVVVAGENLAALWDRLICELSPFPEIHSKGDKVGRPKDLEHFIIAKGRSPLGYRVDRFWDQGNEPDVVEGKTSTSGITTN